MGSGGSAAGGADRSKLGNRMNFGARWTGTALVAALTAGSAGAQATERVSLVTYPRRRNLLEMIMKRSQEDMLESRLSQALGHVPFRAWMKGGFLRLMPYWVEIR